MDKRGETIYTKGAGKGRNWGKMTLNAVNSKKKKPNENHWRRLCGDVLNREWSILLPIPLSFLESLYIAHNHACTAWRSLHDRWSRRTKTLGTRERRFVLAQLKFSQVFTCRANSLFQLKQAFINCVQSHRRRTSMLQALFFFGWSVLICSSFWHDLSTCYLHAS